MTTAAKQKLTFDQFLDRYPEEGRYELVDGAMIEMRAIRWHDDIADFMIRMFDREVERLDHYANN